jgi:hypothetical protein
MERISPIANQTKAADESTSKSQPRTLEWLISILKWYEELRAANATFVHAVLADSAEAALRLNNQCDLHRVAGDIAGAAGIGRIHVLCDELPNSDGLTAANVVKLRANICRAKPCTLEESNVLTLDQAASVLDSAARHPVSSERINDC